MSIVSSTGTELYREVKRASDGVLGVVSQCFVATKAGIGAPPKRLDQYCAKCATSCCVFPAHL